MTDVNDKFPDIPVLDSAGNKIEIARQTGPFVLYSYPKADTPGCTNEAKDFTGLSAEFAKIDCPVFGISKDKPAKLAKFSDKYGLNVTLLSDETGELIDAMGLWIEKSLYGRKYMGIERATLLIGKDGKVAQVWHNVKVKGHADAVLIAAQALG
jgi:thioredoxin-dependent peroxiredoxin